jgi:hypothetical protein
VDIQKDFKEVQGEALIWGDEVHKAFEKRIASGTPLPNTMTRYDHWAAGILAMEPEGVEIKAENRLAITKDFEPTGFFASDVWFRAVIDVIAVTPSWSWESLPPGKVAITLDWKTGAVKPEIEQLGLSAQVVFAHHPEVTSVVSSYIWLGDNKTTPAVYKKENMTPLWNKLWPEIKTLENAFNTTTYPAKPSGLCKNYCPVTSCQYHGKGSY